MSPIDRQIREIFERARIIACVGASSNPERPSHYVSLFLKERGYRVIPVNPGLAGQNLCGETVVGRLSEIDADVDMIDIFRRAQQVAPIVAEALIHLPRLRTVWMQIGVANAQAAKMAGERGVDVIENRCPKIEIQRLFGPDWHVG